MKRSFLMTTLALVLLQAAACGADENPAGQISVSGRATRSAVPDQAVWMVTVTSMHKDLKEAKKDNDDKLGAVLKAGHKIADKDEDVEASRLHVDRQYDYDQKRRQQVFSHFSVRRTVKIRLRDLDRFQEALDMLIKAADVELWFAYEISNEEDLRREIQLEALDNARDKAEGLARRADRHLGPVLSISEYAPQLSPYPGGMEKAMAAPMSDARGGSASPEARELSETIHVVYRLN
jgi:uncharacterized protein YggE